MQVLLPLMTNVHTYILSMHSSKHPKVNFVWLLLINFATTTIAKIDAFGPFEGT